MSLDGVVEFCIHIKNFRNIDLYHQGLYHIRLSFYHEVDEQKIFAYPSLKRDQLSLNTKKKENSVIDSHVFKQGSSYVTKTFLIRFVDEEVEFNESCQFRTEFEASKNLIPPTFYLEAELMFCDLSKLGQSEVATTNRITSFKCISVFKASISNVHLGVNEYVPLMFDDMSFCVLHTTVHASLLDLAFNTGPGMLSKQATMQGELMNNTNQEPVFVFPIKEFAYFLAKKTSNFKTAELIQFYNRYVKTLKHSYETLLDFFNFMLKQVPPERRSINAGEGSTIRTTRLSLIPSTNAEAKVDEGGLKSGEMKEEEKTSEEAQDLQLLLNEEKIHEIFATKDSQYIVKHLVRGLNALANEAFQKWNRMVRIMINSPENLYMPLRQQYHKKTKEKWNEAVFQKIYKLPDLALIYDTTLGENHVEIANSKRKTLYQGAPEDYLSVQDLRMFPKVEEQPIMFEEVCIKDVGNENQQKTLDDVLAEIEKNQLKDDYKGVHLIVLCHGFQGNSMDLHSIKNNLSFLYPHTLFICSSANEDLTEGEIASMGVRLASEVSTYIEEWITVNLSRLSFIGHSLGGLIIRAALPYLERYASKMHLFMTICSPHLGYMYHTSRLIDTGVWLLKKWRKSKCLQELTMSDANDMQDAYLFKLSKAKGLNWFKVVMFISSFQDLYVPYESTRVQISKKAAQDSKRGALYTQMTKNILSNITTSYIYRIDVNFNIVQRTLDSIIGRAAHINFLESHVLMRMLMYRYPKLFG